MGYQKPSSFEAFDDFYLGNMGMTPLSSLVSGECCDLAIHFRLLQRGFTVELLRRNQSVLWMDLGEWVTAVPVRRDHKVKWCFLEIQCLKPTINQHPLPLQTPKPLPTSPVAATLSPNRPSATPEATPSTFTTQKKAQPPKRSKAAF